MSFWWWTLTALAVFLITAAGVIIWLLTIAGHAKPGTDQANARLDTVRTGLAAGAGAAAVGLVLAFRRQHHQGRDDQAGRACPGAESVRLRQERDADARHAGFASVRPADGRSPWPPRWNVFVEVLRVFFRLRLVPFRFSV